MSEKLSEILKQRYRIVEESLKVAGSIVEMDIEEIKKDRRLVYALKGAMLFYVQGLLDISNYVVISRDMTPTNHRDIFDILLRTELMDEKFAPLLDRLVVMRNKLLFAYDELRIEELYDFIKTKYNELNELFHQMIKLSGAL